MKAAVLVDASRFEVKDVVIPELPGEWLDVKVAACGICGSDTAIYARKPPIPRYWPGHEIAGYVGDVLVAINPLVACGFCDFCRSGRETICPNAKMISHHLPGGFAESVKVPSSNIVQIKTTVAEATFVEPLASALHTMKVAGDVKGKAVRVIGCGTVGLLLIQLARFFGAAEVEGIARHAHQAELAERSGSRRLTRAPHVTIVAAGGDGSALQTAVDETASGGRVVAIANVYKSKPLNLKWLVEHELTVSGSQRYTKEDFAHAVRLIEDGKVDVSGLITHRFPLDRISAAYDAAMDKDGAHSIKVIVMPEAANP